MTKLQKRPVRLQSYLHTIRSTLSHIHSHDLVNRQYTPSKRHVYTRLVSQLQGDLHNLEKALEQDGKWLMRLRRWWGGFDVEKLVLELRVRCFRIWEELNRGPL
jgi:hypothetical protein